MNTRLLGAVLIFGSAAIIANGFRANNLDSLGAIVGILWAVGGVCGILGLIQLNALGSSAVARSLAFLPLFGFVALALADLFRLVGLSGYNTGINAVLAGIGWVAMLAGMLVVGILTIAAKVWHGWRRFVPLLTVVVVPIAFGVGQAAANMDFTAVLGFLPWLLLGVVIAAEQPAPSMRQTAAA